MNKIKLIIATATVLAVASVTKAQTTDALSRKNFKTWSVTLGGGMIVARADVKQYDWYPASTYNNERRYGFYGALTKSITPAFALQGQVMRGNASGTDRINSQYFDADIWDFSLNAVINIRNLLSQGAIKQSKFSYFATIGGGICQFKTKLKHLDGALADETINSYGYGEFGGPNKRTMESFLNIGMGVKYNINKDFDLGADIFLRNLNSDKLDAVVNNNENDKYMMLALGLTYHVGKRNAKPYDRTEPTKVLYDQLLAMQSKLDSLTKDTDGDGLTDLYDKDNNTPPNATVDTKGKVIDSDKDGVADEMDKDVFSNKNAKVTPTGEELDDDQDGIPNSKDLEPNTPLGNMVNFQGKTIVNKDADEVKDDKFAFTNQPVIPDAKDPKVNMNTKAPAPTNRTTGSYSSSSVGNSVPVFFSLDNAAVSQKYIQNLAQIAMFMKANPNASIKLIGHTDAVASEDYNYKLGLKRAQIVKEFMVRHFDIKASRIIVDSKGEAELLSKTINQVNRRVEVQVVK